MRPLIAMTLLIASCAGRPPTAERPRDPVEVWIPEGASEKDRAEIAKALEGLPPPSHDRIPPHHRIRQVDILLADDTSWAFLIDLAMKHARELDADAVVLHNRDFCQGPCSDPNERGVDWHTVIEVVRYDPDPKAERAAR